MELENASNAQLISELTAREPLEKIDAENAGELSTWESVIDIGGEQYVTLSMFQMAKDAVRRECMGSVE